MGLCHSARACQLTPCAQPRTKCWEAMQSKPLSSRGCRPPSSWTPRLPHWTNLSCPLLPPPGAPPSQFSLGSPWVSLHCHLPHPRPSGRGQRPLSLDHCPPPPTVPDGRWTQRRGPGNVQCLDQSFRWKSCILTNEYSSLKNHPEEWLYVKMIGSYRHSMGICYI